MKKWNKILGLTVLSSVLLATSAYAGATYQKISAELRPDIKVISNGETQSFKDGNGKSISPITYNGTVYLPVRGVSNVFNSPITWDSKTTSVIIGTDTTGNVPAGTVNAGNVKSVITLQKYMSGADKISDAKELTFKYGDLQEDKTFKNAIRIKDLTSYGKSALINLNGEYASISGVLHNPVSNKGAVTFEIVDADTNVVLMTEKLEPGAFYTLTDFDLQGATSILFRGTASQGNDNTIYFLEPTVK